MRINGKMLYFLVFILLLAGSACTLFIGDIPWADAWSGAIARLNGESFAWNPILDERLPRLIVILCSGAALAVSGTVMQSLFHNPLASPSVLGVSCGGSLLVIIVHILGWHIDYPYAIPMAAIIGSLSTLTLVFFLSRSQGRTHLSNLVLTGIAISTLLIAIQGVIMYALRDQWQLIQTLTEWEAGSTVDRTWKHVHMQLPLTIIGLWGCWAYRHEIDILALGDEEAKNLGVEVETVRWRLFLCVALLTGGAIAAIGIIAFFGLVLPHLMRYLQGSSNNRLIPSCLLTGSAVLVLMDVILRSLKISSFSIGNISAVLGGFFFLMLLFNKNKDFQYEY